MKKEIFLIVSFVTILVLTTCTKIADKPKSISTIVESDGRIVKPKQNNVVLDIDTKIASSQVKDSLNIDVKKVAQYELKITGAKADSIVVGTIIINNSGDIKAYLVTKIISLNEGTKAQTLSFIVVWAIEATLDLVFKDGVKIKFNTKENRAKKNSTYSDKIYGYELGKDPKESVTAEQGKEENWAGYTSSSSDAADGIKMNLTYEHTFDGLKYANTGSGAKFSFKFNGSIRVNPSFDFQLDYNSELHKTSEPNIISFFQSTCSKLASDIFGPSINVGKLKRIKAVSYTDLDYDLNFEFIAEGKRDEPLLKIPLAKPKSVFFAGPVAISEVTNIYLEIDLSIAGAGKGSYYFKKENDITFGFDFQPSNISKINNSELKYVREVISRNEEVLSGIFELKLAAGIKLVVQNETYIYGVLGSQEKAGGSVKASLSQWLSTANQMPGWEASVDAGIFGSASLDLSLFHLDQATWKILKSDELKLELNVYKSPSKVIVLDGNNQTGTIKTLLANPLSVRVYDSRNVLVTLVGVPVYFSGSDLSGYQGTASPNVVLSTNGTATTNWTLGDQIGTQKLLAYLKSQTGAKTGVSSEFIASSQGANHPPASPSGPSPSTGATGISTSPTLGWSCSDSDGDVLTYDVYFGTTSSPTTVIASGQSATSISRSGLSNSTPYYWKVVAKDGKGASTTGPEWKFTTSAANNPPTTPSTPSPANGVTSVSTSPTLSWSCNDPDGDALTYDVYFGTTPNTTTLISSNQTTRSIARTGLSTNTKYYWKIVAKDSKGATTAGTEWNFTTLNLPTGKITGIVRDASTASPLSGVTVSVYMSATLTGTSTSLSDGRYEISVPGNTGYRVIFGKQGYLNAEYQNVNVTVNINTVLEPVLQIDQAYSGNGNISGTIKNALDGAGVASVSLKLRSGINVNSGTIISSTTTSSSGLYNLTSIPAGNYTIEASKTNFNTAYFNVICLGGRTTSNQDATISPILTNETRIVLTWGALPYDLDSHLTGPLSDGTRFHMYFAYKGGTAGSPWPQTVVLDLDDIVSYGPETTTLLQKISGVYRFSVHDYTNRGSASSTALSNSGAQVKVYSSAGLIATFNVPPNTEGTLWTVFEMSNNSITQVNNMTYESTASNVSKGSYVNPDLILFKNLPNK